MIVLGVLIPLGIALVVITIGKSDEWNPRLANWIWVRGAGHRQPPARVRIRMAGYLVAAFGLLALIFAIWFPGRWLGPLAT